VKKRARAMFVPMKLKELPSNLHGSDRSVLKISAELCEGSINLKQAQRKVELLSKNLHEQQKYISNIKQGKIDSYNFSSDENAVDRGKVKQINDSQDFTELNAIANSEQQITPSDGSAIHSRLDSVENMLSQLLRNQMHFQSEYPDIHLSPQRPPEICTAKNSGADSSVTENSTNSRTLLDVEREIEMLKKRLSAHEKKKGDNINSNINTNDIDYSNEKEQRQDERKKRKRNIVNDGR